MTQVIVRTCAYREKKTRVNLNIPKDLKEAAKAEGLNLSKVLENALRTKLKDFPLTLFLKRVMVRRRERAIRFRPDDD